MGSNEIKLIQAFIRLILEVGVPAAISGIKTFSVSDNPTPEEIEALSETLKDSEDYWNA